MVKIAFWDNCLSERGTSVALYNYAYYNRYYLKNESIIIYNTSFIYTKQDVVDKFKKEFEVYGVESFEEVDNILEKSGCDIIYITKAGEYDKQVSKKIKTVVHCVFSATELHGNVYASITPWIKGNDGKYPFVPYMVNLPNHDRNMRSELGIPAEAIVFGRHGGYDQFDISYVHHEIKKILRYTINIYFVFVNTRPFYQHSKIIYLDKIIDLDKKVEFINTCDAMLWGRSDGETFGLSIAEFSVKNKPIFCTNSGESGHISLLGDKAILYNQNNLFNLLKTFDKNIESKKDWNAYAEYTPEKVMDKFKEVFIDT
jgi:hypothetical protein